MGEHNHSNYEDLKLISDQLEKRKYDLAKKMGTDEEVTEERLEIRAQLVGFFAKACTPDFKDSLEQISKWGKNTGDWAIERGTDLSDTLEKVSCLRLTVWKEIEGIALEQGFSTKTIFELIHRLDPLLDQGIHSFTLAFIEQYKTRIQEAHDNFLVLSAPVVPLGNGTAVLPVVGNIDTERAEILLDTALTEANRQSLSQIFIDLSAVPVIDTMVASHIFKIVESMELVGTHAVLVGIRPEVAQTMVNLGVRFKSVETHNTLNQALMRKRIFN
ncbi:STAS domain-containing protein [Piscibacillus halophilus]|uniref:RsbT co-antagonist protein RsbR n=1 Tax=Piscibacillus halophilus TaxID=571933 RepID=A0A1H9CEW0_9BACI|nr:STAS domain-containing protein [Piscibacillus halophilus]SEP99692.1 rsbT co-antagonist protein RsbR [Piscibacillus halophilus]